MFRFLKNIFLSIKKHITRFWQWFLHTSWKKRIAVIIAVIIILIIIKNVFFGGKKQQYTFDTVQKGTITQLVTENGNVISSNENDVYSPTNGMLDQIYVKNGDYVHKGDKLFTVRSTATPQEQAVANANYIAALSAANQAKSTAVANQSKLEQDRQAVITASSNVTTMQNNRNVSQPNPATGLPYSQNDIDAINSALTSARQTFTADEQTYNANNTAIGAAQSQVTSTLLAYQATQNAAITAPADGTISNIIGLTGAKVMAQLNSASTSSTNTSSSTSVTPVLVIGNDSNYAIHTTVSEVDINKVAIGQPVTILFSAVPNATYKGKITQADTYGTNTAGVITYNLFVSIDNADQNIKPNMSANLTIDTAEHKNILTVANAAIVPYQNGKAVQILDKKGKVAYKPVKIGLRGFTRSEVLSGVPAGTKVILGNTTLTNNAGSIGK
ncbi:MAG TPA: HlyD family efflux transporter periplasmic adaptor subunit [Candidatus Saccharimonadales bacterium]|nr:HlyD family efflux transporter periplasmic adaptor subunit [Candidatus Saccharimonadales bacterium]